MVQKIWSTRLDLWNLIAKHGRFFRPPNSIDFGLVKRNIELENSNRRGGWSHHLQPEPCFFRKCQNIPPEHLGRHPNKPLFRMCPIYDFQISWPETSASPTFAPARSSQNISAKKRWLYIQFITLKFIRTFYNPYDPWKMVYLLHGWLMFIP